MSELVLLVGLPQSGMDEYAQKRVSDGYVRLPADATAVSDLLSRGKSVVVAEPILKYKQRMNFLELVRKDAEAPFSARCVVFVVPIPELQRRDALLGNPLGEKGLRKLLKTFDCPYWFEGWDAIEPQIDSEPYEFDLEATVSISQDNPHHRLTIGEHMLAAHKYAVEQGFCKDVCIAALYHDCGKPGTKSYYDAQGNPSDHAHYYEHHHYGAYEFLVHACNGGAYRYETFERTLLLTILVNLHMNPLRSWEKSEKARKREYALFGPELVALINGLHEADLAAH